MPPRAGIGQCGDRCQAGLVTHKGRGDATRDRDARAMHTLILIVRGRA